MGAPAHAATSPSPVASMYTLADTLFSPSLLQSVRLLTSPSAVSTAPRKVWNRTFTPAERSFSSRTSLRPSASKGVMVLVYCLVSGTWPVEYPRRTSSCTSSSIMPRMTCFSPAWKVIMGPTPQPVSVPPR